MSGHTDAPVRCRGCGTIVPAYITGMAAMSRERPYSLSDEFHRYTMESDGMWRCGACQTSDELRKAWALIESLQADREKDRAELAALRERVARYETIASASTAATLDALFDPIHDAVPSHGSDCSQKGDPDCCHEHLSFMSHAELVTKAYNFAVGIMERVAKLEEALVKADEMAKAADTATVWRDKESLDALDLALAVFAEANPVLDNDAREATK